MTALPAQWRNPDLYPHMICEIQDIPCIWEGNEIDEKEEAMKKGAKETEEQTIQTNVQTKYKQNKEIRRQTNRWIGN